MAKSGETGNTRKPATSKKAGAKAAARNTAGGPARTARAPGDDAPAAKAAATEALAAAMPFNQNKPLEIGRDNAIAPPAGATVESDDPRVGASTLSESNASDKAGTSAAPGDNPHRAIARPRPRRRHRAAADHQPGRADRRQPELAEGRAARADAARGLHPAREDHAFRPRAHSRAHRPCARLGGAWLLRVLRSAIPELTRAAPFQAAGKRTPVFVRFSTVAGERGSTDTARDVRGFAVKFYTDEGNWDLVGNNIPVFFIQDAMKFPDLVHAVKPEPHHAMPQAASAHDTFWDFVSLMPESTHMLMWAMSDRAIPRSLRMMQGFGVHTFRLINAEGESVFVKFHWKPLLGTHSLVWDEAVKISGADSDFHRRDLWEAIEAGEYPEWELGLQVFTEEQAEAFSFDVLDATKIVPEELVPLTPVGRLVLEPQSRQLLRRDRAGGVLRRARHSRHRLQQRSAAGGAHPLVHRHADHAPRRTEFPRDPDQRADRAAAQQPARRAASPGDPSRTRGLRAQFARWRLPVPGRRDRASCRSRSRCRRTSCAASRRSSPITTRRRALFYESQTPVEQAHIAAAFRFELSKVTVPAIRRRMVASLRNASEDLAAAVATGLGMELPPPLPRVLAQPADPEVRQSPALSLTALPGDGGIRTRRIAILVADGVEERSVAALQAALVDAGAVPRLVAPRIGPVAADGGEDLDADASLENSPPVLFDAVVLPDGEAGVQRLAADGRTLDFIRDQFRHCKTILALGASRQLLELAGVPPPSEDDPGLAVAEGDDVSAAIAWFVEAVGRHRHPERDRDPPPA